MKRIALLMLLVLAACGHDEPPPIAPRPVQESPPKPAELTLNEFLMDLEGGEGWLAADGKSLLQFFGDGRLKLRNTPRDDAWDVNWEGTWGLTGDQLVLTNNDRKASQRVTAKRDGDDLVLNGRRYTRYRPAPAAAPAPSS